MAQTRRQGLIAALALVLGLACTPALAVLAGLAWTDLSVAERQVLAPLEKDWSQFDEVRKRKWQGIARRYPTMTPDEQQRVQSRMRDWAALTPEQRAKAREQYRTMQQIPPEKRETLKQKWQEYESLPPEERQRIKDTAPLPASVRHPAGKAQPTAAAPKPTAATAAAPAPAPLPPGETPAWPPRN